MKPIRKICGRKTGFTLLELLVVIAIITLLSSMLLPALAKARDMAHRIKCMSRLKQCGIAFMLYTSDYDGYLPVSTESSTTAYWAKAMWLDGGYGLKPYEEGPLFCPTVSKKYGMEPGVNSYQHNYAYNRYMCDKNHPLKSSRVERSNEFLLLMDGAGGAGGEIRNAASFEEREGGAWPRICYYCHLGSANALFFDGHVESVKEGDLTQVKNLSPYPGYPHLL